MMKKLIVLVILLLCFIFTACKNSSYTDATLDITESPKYNVQIDVDCVKNLFFSRYDVNILINGVSIGILDHGMQNTYQQKLERGTYTLTFIKEGNSSIDGNVKFDISEDTTLKYRITCTSDQVEVEQLSIAEESVQETLIPTDTPAEEANIIAMKKNSNEYIGMDYKDAEEEFRTLGFINFLYRDIDTNDKDKVHGQVSSVNVVKSTSPEDFAAGDKFDTDIKIEICYYTKKPELIKHTIENNSELANILSNKSEIDSSYTSFAVKYKGQLIEFNGHIDYIVNYKDYNTRYEILVSSGDYDPNHQIGPTFKFEDINAFDLGLDTMFLSDEIWVGRNVVIVAKVEKFDSNTGLFYLDPVSVTGR